MAQIRRRSRKPLYTLITVVAAVAGWSTLLWPPVHFFYTAQDSGLWKTIGELLKPVNSIYPDGVLIGWVFIATTILLIITLPLAIAQFLSRITRYVEASEADVSLLQIDITLRFDDLLSKCVVVREQLLHANQPGTGAYHYVQTVDEPGARIIAGTFEMSSRIGNNLITRDFVKRSSKSKFEAIEIFKSPLPTSWLATYLPDWLVLFLYEHTSILDRVIVERVGEIVIEGDHDGNEPIFQLNSHKRRGRNVSVSLDFPANVAPRTTDIKCFVIKDNIVSSIYPRCKPVGDRRIYSAFIAELDESSLRIQWTNGRLEEAKAAMETPSVSERSKKKATS